MIALRDIRPGDKDMLRDWRNLPEVSKYMYTDHHIGEDEHARWFERALNDPTRKYWIITCDGEDVGLTNLYDIDRKNQRCYWAIYLANPGVRGKGVGSFAEYSVLHYVFEVLGLHKLCVEALAFNQAAVNTYKGFGFRQDGLLRHHFLKKSGFVDVVSMSMLAEEWAQNKAALEAKMRAKGLLK